MTRKDKLDRPYLSTLDNLVDRMFDRAYSMQWNWSEIAKRSGLAYETVRNLGERKTRLPQFRTVELLARCLGGHVVFESRPSKRKNIKATWTPKVFGGRRKNVA